MVDVKSVNQGRLKGLVKSTRTPQGLTSPSIWQVRIYLGVRDVMPCSSDWRKKEGCLPKVRIGDFVIKSPMQRVVSSVEEQSRQECSMIGSIGAKGACPVWLKSLKSVCR
jgi:hypothetical protein